jgi:hypothetical protein
MGEKFITVFENRTNIKKLIQLLEQKVKEEEAGNEKKKQEKAEIKSKERGTKKKAGPGGGLSNLHRFRSEF